MSCETSFIKRSNKVHNERYQLNLRIRRDDGKCRISVQDLIHSRFDPKGWRVGPLIITNRIFWHKLLWRRINLYSQPTGTIDASIQQRINHWSIESRAFLTGEIMGPLMGSMSSWISICIVWCLAKSCITLRRKCNFSWELVMHTKRIKCFSNCEISFVTFINCFQRLFWRNVETDLTKFWSKSLFQNSMC